jgi:hypothetical protein
MKRAPVPAAMRMDGILLIKLRFIKLLFEAYGTHTLKWKGGETPTPQKRVKSFQAHTRAPDP